MQSDASCLSSTSSAQPAVRQEFLPAVDVSTSPEGLTIVADLPGVASRDIEVEFESGVLSLRGPVAARGAASSWMRREYGVGDFRRSFQIGEGYDGSKARAECRDGVLWIRVPVAETQRARRVPVQVAQN